jgi:hypothetical protein
MLSLSYSYAVMSSLYFTLGNCIAAVSLFGVTERAVLNESMGAIAVLSFCKGRVHSHLRSTVAQRISDEDAIYSIVCTLCQGKLGTAEKDN